MANKVSVADNEKVRFKVRNRHKYMGDPDNIIIRSSWEARAFEFFDNNINVLLWGSEEIAIEYMKPHPDGHFRKAKYYPDIYVEYINKDGTLIKEVFEIKPEKFTKKSRARNPDTKMFENYQYIVNMAKFHAAEEWCKRQGYKFSILSEKSIFRN